MNISNLVYDCVGLIGVGLGLIFLIIIKYSFYKGMSIPLLIIGLIAITNHNLLINKWLIDFTGLLIGGYLFINFHKSQQKYWKGIGLGIIISCLMVIVLNTLLLLN